MMIYTSKLQAFNTPFVSHSRCCCCCCPFAGGLLLVLVVVWFIRGIQKKNEGKNYLSQKIPSITPQLTTTIR
jgi:hypothetical protein